MQKNTVSSLLNSPRYKRLGECNKCGNCCVAEDCELFDSVSRLCKDYEHRFPRCRNLPAAPPIMVEGCSYKFKELETGRILGVKQI